MSSRVQDWLRFGLGMSLTEHVAALGVSASIQDKVLDLIEYARLDVLRESCSMEEVLGRPAVPGDGVFSVG
jgi:hypothetical protein